MGNGSAVIKQCPAWRMELRALKVGDVFTVPLPSLIIIMPADLVPDMHLPEVHLARSNSPLAKGQAAQAGSKSIEDAAADPRQQLDLDEPCLSSGCRINTYQPGVDGASPPSLANPLCDNMMC
ncbi:hypothetical protein CVT26_011666 [Gymnopilus dilepis]|uniref:Uncharacterized protein n=1 Tax=Gymnopilus dilepis TaxID=231916 RepID=A0A409W8X8_9AGAR|nr:hypothetical protein CVT26_011666 [Gymnopilus dilepis]